MENLDNLYGLLRSASEVREDTIEHEREKINQTFEVWGYLVDWGIYFLNVSAKAEASWMLSIEATQDIWSSVFLAIHGFYRLALISLRSGYELLILGIYFDHNLRDYKLWSKDEKSAPRPSFGKATQWLFNNLPLFKQFNEKYGLKKELNDFYDELSGFMHARGDRREILISLTRVLHGLTYHSYTKESFERWHLKLLQMFDLCNVVFMLNHPIVWKNPEEAIFPEADKLISKMRPKSRKTVKHSSEVKI